MPRSLPPRLPPAAAAPDNKRKRGRPSFGPCPHGVRPRSKCKTCGACPHGRRPRQCKDCGGAGICVHGRVKYYCADCGGASVCIHGRQKYSCRECGGASICPHGRKRSQCVDCGGSGICEHGVDRRVCKKGCKITNGGGAAAFVSTGSRGTSVWTAVVKESVRTASSDATATNAGEADGVRTVA